MSLPWKLVVALCCLLLGARAGAASTPEDIARWVRQLDDRRYSVREKASRSLWAAGQAAEPALQEALKSPDPEVVRRAREILDKFKYGLYPDTPEAIVKLVEQYRSGDAAAQQSVLQQLFKEGRPGYAVLVKLAAAEDNPETRRRLSEQIARQAAQLAEADLAEGDVSGAEDLLEMSLASTVDAAVRNYAAWFLLRGTLDDKIRQFQARHPPFDDKQAAEILAYLYRARGDLAGSRPWAEKSGKTALLEGILWEQGDWKALAQVLARKPDLNGSQGQAASPAVKATCQRLAGNTAEFEAELPKAVEEGGLPAAEVLFFNDRPREAIAALVQSRDYARAFEFLTYQLKYREAFELADGAKNLSSDGRFLLDLYRARTLYLLGEKDKGLQLFAQAADQIKTEGTNQQNGQLIETAYQLGLTDLAFEHCARVLTRVKNDDSPTWLLAPVFPKQADVAVVWLKFFRRKFPGEEPAGSLKRVRDLLEGKTSGPDFAALAQEAEAAVKDASAWEQAQWLTAVGETALALGQEELARTYLEKAAHVPGPSPNWNPAPWLRLGDVLADGKHWKEAAECYDQAWQCDRKKALPLYLRGWSLTHLGRDKEGRQLMDRAHWLPLANDEVRYDLAEALTKHGLDEEARRERDLILRTGAFLSVYVTNMQNRLEAEALTGKDYFKAADCCRRVLLSVLQTGTSFIKTRAYVSVPCAIHRYRARGLVAAGRTDEARQEIQLCLDALPADTDLPILLVPELEKAGDKKDADELFTRVFDVHVHLCTEYPSSAWCHNTLAWMAARCRRQLDPALEHARKSVELEPKSAGYRDTLAEVHFQRGDKEQAIATMKKCLELEPKNEYFQKQLKRFEAGDPSAEVPQE